MQLTDQQATSILVEGLQRNLFEPAVPAEESDRLKDATALVEACEKVHKAGNKSDNVETILFIAKCDMNLVTEQIEGQTSIPVQDDTSDLTKKSEIRDTRTNTMHNGLNLAELSEGILDQLIVGLDQYPQTDEVEIDRKAYTAEKERRNNGSGKGLEEDSPAQDPPAEAETSGAASGESGKSAVLVDGEADSGISSEAGGSAQEKSKDASAFARAQTPETSGKEKPSKAKAQEKDGERAELESKLNYDMVKAHNTDLLSLSKAPINELRYIVENPSGPNSAEEKEDKVPITESEVVGVTNPKLDNALGGIVAVKSVEQKIVTKSDLNLDIDDDQDENRGGISSERETLETLVTGPMLKNYKRGRKEVPSIGDNELRLMVLNPTGEISPEELQKAQMMDGKSVLVEPKAASDIEPDLGDPNVSVVEDRTIAEAALEQKVENAQDYPIPGQSEIINKPEELVGPIKKSEGLQNKFAPGENPTTDIELPSGEIVKVVTEIQKMPKEVEVSEEILAENKPLTGQARAMEIIERENMPIPPDITDPAPILPADVSKCSRDELFSYHARYHAYESRMNWILSSFEDELGDIEKLRRVREIDVAASIPLLAEDGKRITNEARDAQVAADSLAIQYYEEEHEKKKTVNKLKVLQRNYMKDCERISRQMSKYEREKQDAPR